MPSDGRVLAAPDNLPYLSLSVRGGVVRTILDIIRFGCPLKLSLSPLAFIPGYLLIYYRLSTTTITTLRFAKARKRIVEGFSIDRATDEYIKLYKELRTMSRELNRVCLLTVKHPHPCPLPSRERVVKSPLP
jgi:hypothetical protein